MSRTLHSSFNRIFTHFFCKQKTAYEMRISDWSSDVCSSDLLAASLDPDRPLSRGFARVMDGDRLVSSAAAAQAAGQVTLKFKDGEVDADISERLEKSAGTATSKTSKARPSSSGRSEERRVGKAVASTCRFRWSPDHLKK